MQVTMNDTSKFVDMLHNVPWEDGLPNEVVEGVYESSFLSYHIPEVVPTNTPLSSYVWNLI